MNESGFVVDVMDLDSSCDVTNHQILAKAPLQNQPTEIHTLSQINNNNSSNNNNISVKDQGHPAAILNGSTSYKEEEQSSVQHYHRVESWCRHHITNRSDNDFLFDQQLWSSAMKCAAKDLMFPLESLQSFFRNMHVKHIKSTSYKVLNQSKMYVDQYRNGTSILQLAKNANFSPHLMARLVVERVADTKDRNLKTFVKDAIRDPLRHLGSIECIQDDFRHGEGQWALQQQQQSG
jgi:hypothetical protein